MSNIDHTSIPLEPECYYHLFNRGNYKQNIFYKVKNYNYFLKKYAEYMEGYLETYAYCLLPNHFHLLVKVKGLTTILEQAILDMPLINEKTWQQWNFKVANFEFPSRQKMKLTTILEMDLPVEMPMKIATWAVSEKARRWLMAYAKAINKQEDFSGSLFQKKFRRILITDMDYLRYLVWYVHNNPVHHNIFHDLQNYPHSSYQTFLAGYPTKLLREKVLKWYGGLNEFVEYHKRMTLGYDGNDIKFWTE